jgi:hypothetical protein
VRSFIDPARLRLALLALFAALALVGSRASAQETCVACHSTQADPRLRDPVERLRGSVHARALGCSGCHGGRGNEPTVQAHDATAGFVARPDPATVANRCGTCHADARFVRRFRDDLSTDQLALYYADAHGRALAHGNLSAPSCLECHGSHDVRAPNDPAARIARRRQHETCAGCHSDPARMAGSRLPTNQAALWAESVHGRAVLAHGNLAAPTCAGCHGAHGEYREAGGPEGRCRRCHEDEAAAFDRSPHASAYRRLGFSGCVACHGSHDVREADGALGTAGGIGVCRRCHGEGRSSDALVRRIAMQAEQARRDLGQARAAVRALEGSGLRVPAVTALVDEASQADVRLRVALHSLDEGVARDAAAAVSRPAQRARELAQRARERDAHGRRAWLMALPPLALLLALALLKIRQLDRARG